MLRRRLSAIAAATALVAGGAAAIALASGPGPVPPAKPLARAVHDALTAPAIAGVTARISFHDRLLDSASLQGSDPLMSGGSGRVWAAPDGHLRLELQGDSGDVQVVSDGRTVLVSDLASRSAWRFALPRGHERADRVPTIADVQAALGRAAQHLDLSGAVPGDVAGRPAYTVRVAPQRDGGLVGAAELAWDAVHGTPLRAALYARGQSAPVLDLAVTDISYGRVDPSVFAVSAPAGTKVTDVTGGGHEQPAPALDVSLPSQLGGMARSELRRVHGGVLATYGQGLGGLAVLATAADRSAPAHRREGQPGVTLPTVTIAGATAEELRTPLGTAVRFTRGGVTYTLIGSVTPATAEAAARGL